MEAKKTTPTPPPSVNPSPKNRFLQSPELIVAHRALLDSPQMERSIDFAELEYLRKLCDTSPSDITSSNYMAASAACFQRIQGMHEFLSIFRGLAEKPGPVLNRPTDNLKHF